MRSLSTCLGFECNQSVDQDNYVENVSGRVPAHAAHMQGYAPAAHWPVCKVHRGIQTLINLFLLPGVYSNALEVVMEDIWRSWFRLEKTESRATQSEEASVVGSRAHRKAKTHRA